MVVLDAPLAAAAAASGVRGGGGQQRGALRSRAGVGGGFGRRKRAPAAAVTRGRRTVASRRQTAQRRRDDEAAQARAERVQRLEEKKRLARKLNPRQLEKLQLRHQVAYWEQHGLDERPTTTMYTTAAPGDIFGPVDDGSPVDAPVDDGAIVQFRPQRVAPTEDGLAGTEPLPGQDRIDDASSATNSAPPSPTSSTSSAAEAELLLQHLHAAGLDKNGDASLDDATALDEPAAIIAHDPDPEEWEDMSDERDTPEEPPKPSAKSRMKKAVRRAIMVQDAVGPVHDTPLKKQILEMQRRRQRRTRAILAKQQSLGHKAAMAPAPAPRSASVAASISGLTDATPQLPSVVTPHEQKLVHGQEWLERMWPERSFRLVASATGSPDRPASTPAGAAASPGKSPTRLTPIATSTQRHWSSSDPDLLYSRRPGKTPAPIDVIIEVDEEPVPSPVPHKPGHAGIKKSSKDAARLKRAYLRQRQAAEREEAKKARAREARQQRAEAARLQRQEERRRRPARPWHTPPNQIDTFSSPRPTSGDDAVVQATSDVQGPANSAVNKLVLPGSGGAPSSQTFDVDDLARLTPDERTSLSAALGGRMACDTHVLPWSRSLRRRKNSKTGEHDGSLTPVSSFTVQHHVVHSLRQTTGPNIYGGAGGAAADGPESATTTGSEPSGGLAGTKYKNRSLFRLNVIRSEEGASPMPQRSTEDLLCSTNASIDTTLSDHSDESEAPQVPGLSARGVMSLGALPRLSRKTSGRKSESDLRRPFDEDEPGTDRSADRQSTGRSSVRNLSSVLIGRDPKLPKLRGLGDNRTIAPVSLISDPDDTGSVQGSNTYRSQLGSMSPTVNTGRRRRSARNDRQARKLEIKIMNMTKGSARSSGLLGAENIEDMEGDKFHKEAISMSRAAETLADKQLLQFLDDPQDMSALTSLVAETPKFHNSSPTPLSSVRRVEKNLKMSTLSLGNSTLANLGNTPKAAVSEDSHDLPSTSVLRQRARAKGRAVVDPANLPLDFGEMSLEHKLSRHTKRSRVKHDLKDTAQTAQTVTTPGEHGDPPDDPSATADDIRSTAPSGHPGDTTDEPLPSGFVVAAGLVVQGGAANAIV